jgi:hypothetical protein
VSEDTVHSITSLVAMAERAGRKASAADREVTRKRRVAERRGDREAVVQERRVVVARTATAAEELRAIENERLDVAEAAIWEAVKDGDLKAIAMFLRISARRSRMNGMDAPVRVDMSIGIRAEMEAKLAELRDVVLGEVIGDTSP